jgi:two-component system, NarL family, nitrate/nitrite response regulator NarL
MTPSTPPKTCEPQICRTVDVLIVGRIRLWREALAQCLAAQQGIRVAGVAAEPEDAIKQARRTGAQVVLLDMGAADSHLAIGALNAVALRVVGLALEESEAKVVAAIEAGMVGYVPADEGGLDDVSQTVELVDRGQFPCSATVAAMLLRRLRAIRAERAHDPLAELTKRELEIARLIGDGLANKDIAIRLGISLATVKNHVHSILDKLHVSRRGQAAALLNRSRFNRTI